MSIKEHPNYGLYIKESHTLSVEISARMQDIATRLGDSEEGAVQAKALHLEEARRRKELQQKFGLLDTAGTASDIKAQTEE